MMGSMDTADKVIVEYPNADVNSVSSRLSIHARADVEEILASGHDKRLASSNARMKKRRSRNRLGSGTSTTSR
jgi:hypothetical protein